MRPHPVHPRAAPRRLSSIALVGLAAAALAGCGGSGGSASGVCGRAVAEPEDPASSIHVIDPASARFRTDPPTSGPHLAAPGPRGVVTEPLLPAVQVVVLERGDVLVQYRDPAERGAAEALAGDHVVVAPNPTLPAPVVATAWLWKLSCTSVDAPAIGTFAAQRVGKAPGTPPAATAPPTTPRS